MKIINYLLLFLLLISLLEFSSAYQTFSVSRERLDVDNAVVIVDLESSKVIQQETLIRLYPDQIKKYGYSELLNYTKYINKEITSFTVYNEDKTALSMSDEIIKETGLSIAIYIGKSSLNDETIKLGDNKASTGNLGSITTGSLINLESNSSSVSRIYTLIICGIVVLIGLIVIIGKRMGHF